MLAESEVTSSQTEAAVAPVETEPPAANPEPPAPVEAPVTEAEAPPVASTPSPPAASKPLPSAVEEPPTDPPPTDPPPPEKREIVHHRQSQEQINLLEEHALLVEGLGSVDIAFQTMMVEHGITAERLAANLVLNRSAYEAIDRRLQAFAASMGATAQQANAFSQVRAAYSAYRQVARTLIRDEAGRAALRLDERMSYRLASFPNEVAASLTAAQSEPYATQLATAGYDAERLAGIEALLGAFEQISAQCRLAHKAAEDATIVRDATVMEVRTALRQLKVEVRTILRRYPNLIPPMGI